MNVYVAYVKKSGKRGWLVNPKPFFDGRVYITFTPSTVMAGVVTELFKTRMEVKDFKKILVDELDRLCVPWTEAKRPMFGTKMVDGSQYELYLADINLTGPLPQELAARTKGTRKAYVPVKVMVRYGG